MTRKQSLISRIIFVLYLCAVAWLCFGHFDSTPDVPTVIFGIPTDKIVHFSMFLPFPIVTYFAFNRYSDKFLKAFLWLWAVFFIGALLAAGTELGQGMTDYRSADHRDFLADLCGLGTGSLAVLLLMIRKK